MIAQRIFLEDYEWLINVFFGDDNSSTEELIDFMEIMHCSKKEMASMRNIVDDSRRNVGFTYTDFDNMSTVVYISPCDSPSEYQNTFDHEKGHIGVHIATYYDIDPYGEEYQYLNGEIGERLFDVAKLFICN